MKHIYHKEDAEVVRIEGEAPRTLYTLVEPNTVGTEHFSMGLEEIDPHSEIPHPLPQRIRRNYFCLWWTRKSVCR